MPVFMIERNFATQLEVTPEGAAVINQISHDSSMRRLISFLSIDKKKTFCLYEAPSVQAIRDAAAQAGIPADEIVEVEQGILLDGTMNPVHQTNVASSISALSAQSDGTKWRAP